jgi:hypothetical protein
MKEDTDLPLEDMLPKVIKSAMNHLEQLHALAAAGQITWTEMSTPRPNAMRAFQGRAGTYLLNVAQANITDVGVTHDGVLIADECLVIRIPAEDAQKLYHQAVAQRN